MLVNKRTLFVSVTLDTRGIGARRQSRLFQLESAVWVVAIAASHRAFEHFVMERQVELVLGLAVTTEAKLWLALLQQAYVRKARLLCVCRGDEDVRGRELSSSWWRVGGVAVSATDVIAPVLAAAEVVVFFSACVTA